MKLIEKKVRGNWVIKIISKKSIHSGKVTYSLYVFDRTLRQFALIKNFEDFASCKDFFNNLIKK